MGFGLIYCKVMLYAENLEESLLALKVVLSHFAQGLGYKINESKSVLMGLSLLVEVRERLGILSEALIRDRVKYLGIWLVDSQSVTPWIECNLTSVIDKVRTQLLKW